MDIIKECCGAKRIGISGHVRPDGDCVGACLALSLYLQKALPEADITVYLEQPADIFKEIKGFDSINSEFPEQEPFDVYFCLDAGADRIGAAEPYFRNAVKKINIDHHISNQGCGDINVVRPQVASACEVLYQLMDKSLLDIDIATALYIGMIHDTGVFQYSNTTKDTLEAAADLIGYGFEFPRMIEETFYQKTYMQTKILGKVLMDSLSLAGGSIVVGKVEYETMQAYGATSKDLDGIVNQLRNIKGVHCAIFAYEINPSEYKFSLRTDAAVSATEVVEQFGGGGHVRAAGCTMKGDYKECLERLVKAALAQMVRS